MNGVYFKEVNVEYAKDQPEYKTLPALRINSERGEVITCWGLSFKERLKVLFFGKIWLSLLSFNNPLTPIYMTTNKKEVINHEKTNK